MSLQDNVKNAQASTKEKSFGEVVVMGISTRLKAMFKEEDNFKEFARSVSTVLDSETNVKHPFQKCDVGNIHRAILKAAGYNLIPNMYDYCYLIPYMKTCKFEFGYMGLIELARRTNRFRDIFANVVFEKDKIDIDLANGKIVHKPNLLIDRGKMVGCYAIAEFKNGVKRIEVMGMDDFKKIKGLSKNTAVVNKWESEFFRKSTLKRLTKTLPFSKEDRRDIVKGEDEPDEAIITIDDIDLDEVDLETMVETVKKADNSKEFVKEEKPKEEKPKEVKEELKKMLNKKDEVSEIEEEAKQFEADEIAENKAMVEEEDDPFADNPFEIGEY